MANVQKITPCLWFDGQAEEAANYYTRIFDNSEIVHIDRFLEAGQDIHGQEPGRVMVVVFKLEGQQFIALNGGPQFKFNEAISFQVLCSDQEEIDYFWGELSRGGDKEAQQCGWLKDRFGVSWQVVPGILPELLSDPDKRRANHVMSTLLQMKKIEIDKLLAASAE